MSSSNKTTSRGGKGANKDTEHAPGGEKTNKTHKKSDGKSDSGGGNSGKKGGKGSHQQASHHDNRNNQIDKSEDAEVKKKVHTVMEATLKNEEEVYLALVDCNYNMELAIEQLLEGNAQGEWNTFKKKKNRQTSTSKAETGGDVTANAATEDWDTPPSGPPAGGDRDRSRTRGGGPPRHRGRGGGRRENRENDRDDGGRNDGGFGGARRNRMQNGPPRGGGSGRGGRGGGRLGGPRSFQSRDGGRSGYNSRAPVVDTWDMDSAQQNTQPIDTWDSFPQPEDWDNEEYTGSLADTKVFTPSNANEAAETPGGGAVPPGAVPAGPQQQDSAIVSQEPPSVVQQLHNEVIAASVTPEIHPPPTAAQQLTQALELRASQPPPQVSPQQVSMPPAPQSTTLSAAQSQYLSQLTQQTSENMKAAAAAAAVSNAVQQSTYQSIPYSASAANSYNSSGYGATTNYTSAIQQEQPTVVQQQPTRTKTQRARVPPPSKIPASAVEMPGDLNTSIGFLDVQFGGLDLVSDNNSFESVAEVKYSNSSVLDSVPASTPATNLDINSVNQSLDAYSNSSASKQQSAQSNLNSALVQAQSQILSNTEQTNDHLSSSVNSSYSSSRSSGSVQQQQQTSNTPQSVVSPIDVNKTAEVVAHSGYAQPTQPNSYHQTYQSQKTNSSPYQSTPAYSSTNYSANVQVTSSSSYPPSQSTNSYSANSANNSSSAAVAAAAYNSNSNQQNSSAGNSSYQTSSYSTTAYQSTAPAFAAISQPAAFPTNNQYQTNPSQSVYAAAGLNNSSTYPTQYNSYNTASTNHKLGTASSNKDSQSYDSTGSAAVSSTGVVSSVTNAVSASVALTGLSNSQTNTSTTASKVTTTSAAKSGIVPNMPPGVAPMVGTQYIMGQAGMPFYQQPVYSYEDLQLLQQRIPHMTTGYYDMGYQTPTSLATGREGGLASVAYSMSDGRFTRADNNASPVPSTISQQTTTQAHQAQPMLNATLPPGYAYFYGTGMLPGSFQYGTPAIYPQMPTATNAHGSTTSSQYPKPGSYGSGYGSGYDALSQSTQDYNKSAYVGANQTQNKTGVAVTTGSSVATDLTTAMYGKTHAALGKVNSYEKQGFHSGTPPPFNLAGNQSAGMAPSGTYAPHLFIPTMAPHQTHHNTLMQHQPLHQMDVRHAGRRTDSGNSTGQRTQTSSQAKPGAKQAYQNSYWNAA